MSLHFIFMVLYAIFVVISVISLVIPVISVISVNRHTGDTFLSSEHSHMSVNDMLVSFKSEVIAAIERFILTKMTKTKYSLPWIDSSI